MPHVRPTLRLGDANCERGTLEEHWALTYPSCSGADKEEQGLKPDEVQGPMQALPLHSRAQGLGQGGEAQAESATRYAIPQSKEVWTGDLTNCVAGLTISDVPKKNQKGKRVAKS